MRHYHAIGEGGVTPLDERFPTARGGDMEASQKDAQRMGRIQSEALDIVTEHGWDQVHFGYDPKSERPFFIDIPGPGGGRIYETSRRWRTTGRGARSGARAWPKPRGGTLEAGRRRRRSRPRSDRAHGRGRGGPG